VFGFVLPHSFDAQNYFQFASTPQWVLAMPLRFGLLVYHQEVATRLGL
jgi:hypothetical protein